MCIHSRWPELQVIALDTLSNVSNEVAVICVRIYYNKTEEKHSTHLHHHFLQRISKKA